MVRAAIEAESRRLASLFLVYIYIWSKSGPERGARKALVCYIDIINNRCEGYGFNRWPFNSIIVMLILRKRMEFALFCSVSVPL